MRPLCGILLCVTFSLLYYSVEGKIQRSVCTAGFHQHGSSCYWFSNIQGTFAEASALCRFLGSELVSITSSGEDAFIREYATQTGKAFRYFLGGTDLGLEGQWKWTRNRAFTFTNWYPGEPNNQKNNDHCIEAGSAFAYRWNDIPCDARANFICEINI